MMSSKARPTEPSSATRILSVWVTPGEELLIWGEELFVSYELDGIYNELSTRSGTVHCEGCDCEQEADQEGDNEGGSTV